jgi:hypothetical protein
MGIAFSPAEGFRLKVPNGVHAMPEYGDALVVQGAVENEGRSLKIESPFKSCPTVTL